MNLSQLMNPNYAPGYFMTTMAFMLTAIYFIVPLMHQLDYGFTNLAKWRGWKEKINTEELSDNMINAVFEQTKTFTPKDFDMTLEAISAVLPELMKRMFPGLLCERGFTARGKRLNWYYLYLANNAFSNEF